MNTVFVELPGYGEVALSISHTARRLLGSDDPNDVAVTWHSTLIALDADDGEHIVATAVTHIVHESRLDGWSVVDVLESISGDVADYTELFDHNGELAPALADNYAGGLIVADRVSVVPSARGHGLGPLLLAETLIELGAVCELAVCTPAPFEEPTGYEHGAGGPVLTDAAAAARWERRQAELCALWSRLGFRRYGATPTFTLDLVEPTLDQALADIRAAILGTESSRS